MPKRRAPLSSLDGIARTLPDGTPITVESAALEALSRGAHLDLAASVAGVTVSTLRSWLANGARVERARMEGVYRRSEHSAHDLACERFTTRAREAMATAELRLIRALDQASAGWERRKETTTLDAGGNVLERRVEVQNMTPDWPTIRWRLERRYPDRWGPTLEVRAEDPIESRTSVETLLGELDRMGANLARAHLANVEPVEPVETNGNGHHE